jgi:serine/threonine protein kinase
MHESEIVEPVDVAVDYAAGYSMPELYLATSNAVLYRVRKAGKYFIIKTPKDNSGQGLAMLQREYELSLGKTHPNIVTVFTFEQNTIVGPGIVMEYVDGRTLTAFLAENGVFVSDGIMDGLYTARRNHDGVDTIFTMNYSGKDITRSFTRPDGSVFETEVKDLAIVEYK